MSALSGMSGSFEDIRVDYLNLLVTQLRNQNPLEPMSNDQMASQLTQLSQLERLESMDSTFLRALTAARHNQAIAMIGKQVAFFPPGEEQAVTGRVDSVDIVDGEVALNVGSHQVDLDQIRFVTN